MLAAYARWFAPTPSNPNRHRNPTMQLENFETFDFGVFSSDVGPLSGRRKARRRTDAQNPLETYLREINETKLLTAEEERMLAHSIADGDVRARDRMVRANLRLVVNIARGYTGKGLGLQDLIEEGNLGLLRAVEGFDPDMGTRFSTYASYWIKQSINVH
jgi:RNA polymerase primary sigma factor